LPGHQNLAPQFIARVTSLKTAIYLSQNVVIGGYAVHQNLAPQFIARVTSF
jgi:hypothetical protein